MLQLVAMLVKVQVLNTTLMHVMEEGEEDEATYGSKQGSDEET
ncbi:hypothetical protein A2U01_0111490, partial [Trifolium medium]|nr:hypothetical protein [Trifolium medium]